MDPRTVLRLARPADAGPIARMTRALIETGLAPRYSSVRMARIIADRDMVTLVAEAEDAGEDSGEPRGFAVMAFGDERAYLTLLAVQPALRRQGLARAMLEWLLHSAEVAGMDSVALELRADNTAAQALYKSMGFEITALVPGYYDGRVDALRMVRAIRAPGIAPDTDWSLPGLPGRGS